MDIHSPLQGARVGTRCVIIEGSIHGIKHGIVTVVPYQQAPLNVTLVNGIFKAFVPLVLGHNTVQLSCGALTSTYTCTYEPKDTPPLKLVIITASDSPLTYDEAPNARHPPNLDTAIKKLRMAGYIWAAYTAKEMSENGFAYSSFNLDESVQPDTITDNAPRQTANVLILKSAYTTDEIRNPERAQQNAKAGSASGLFDIALQTLSQDGRTNGQKEYIAAIFLDAHYDGKLITGHAALGGGTAQHSLAIFGSHSLFSWPTCIAEIEPCFTDERPVDTNSCGIDGEGRTYFSACSVGVGAMMHEVGHLFGCPHQESGVMLRDYVRLHRSLTAIEPPSALSVVGHGITHWHRLDILRFAGHACFGPQVSGGITALPTIGGLEIRSDSGIRAVEVYRPGREFPTWIELNSTIASLRKSDIAADANRLQVIAGNASITSIDTQILTPTREGGLLIFQSPTVGARDGTHQRFILPPAIPRITVYSGVCVDGIDFHSHMLGNKGGSATTLDFAPNEYLLGFRVRSGLWIDGISVITNLRESQWFGSQGGSETVMISPGGYRVCGVQGVSSQWMDQFGMLYTAM